MSSLGCKQNTVERYHSVGQGPWFVSLCIKGSFRAFEVQDWEKWKHWQTSSCGNCCKISSLTWSIVFTSFSFTYLLNFSLKNSNCKPFPYFLLPLWPNGSSFFSHSGPCLGYWMWFPVKFIPQVPSDLPAAGHGSLGMRKLGQAALQWGNSQLSNRREEAAPKYHRQLLRTNY